VSVFAIKSLCIFVFMAIKLLVCIIVCILQAIKNMFYACNKKGQTTLTTWPRNIKSVE